MTTTEHAELIERLETLVQIYNKQRLAYDFGSPTERYFEGMADGIENIICEVKDALRTSRRDGWLEAADELMREADTPAAIADFYKHPYFRDASDHLRRNAPQEATDEA